MTVFFVPATCLAYQVITLSALRAVPRAVDATAVAPQPVVRGSPQPRVAVGYYAFHTYHAYDRLLDVLLQLVKLQ